MKKAWLLETSEDAEFIHSQDISSEAEVIVLSAEALNTCSSMGITCKTYEEIVGIDWARNATVATMVKADLIAKLLAKKIQDSWPKYDKIIDDMSLWLWLKRLCDQWFRFEYLAKTLQNSFYDEVMMVARPRRFREWVLVSEFPFDKYNIKQSVFSVSPEVKFSNKPYDVFKKIHKLKRFLLLKWELRRVESKEVDLFFCTGGDVNLLSEHLLTDSIRVYDPKEYLNIIKSRLSNNISREIVDKVQEIFDERFFIKNIGLYNLAILDFFRDRLVEVLNVGFLSENKLLPKFNRVFTGNHADSLINAIIHAAKKVGTKTFCLQHGGNSGYILQPECFRTEYYWSDYFISYGPGVDALLDNQNAPSRSSGLGSLYLNSFKSISGFNKDHKKKPTIFYLTSSFNAYLRHMGNYCYPDTWYYGLTLRVLDVLRKYSTQYDIVIKLHPKGAQGPFTKQNYEITKGFRVIDQAFESVWEEADAYIMDYCSTPLGLVLQTNKPLILLSEKEFIDFTDEAEKKLKLRALFTTNTNTFLHNIDLFMSQWNGKWTLNSSEFRDAYFKPSNNLQSYTRSLDDLGFK